MKHLIIIIDNQVFGILGAKIIVFV